MKTPSYYRARIAYINQLIAAETDDKNITWLRAGYIPADYQADAEKHIVAMQTGVSDEPLSDVEKTTYSTWFHIHPELQAGTEKAGSGFLNPVKTVGDWQDAQRVLAIMPTLAEPSITSMKTEKPNQEPTMKQKTTPPPATEPEQQNPQERPALSPATIAILENASQKDKEEEKKGDTLTFDEVFELYNDGIGFEEVQAWVWYKRSNGIPMTGWEKYYLKAVNVDSKYGQNDTLIYASETVTLLDNAYQSIRTIPTGTLIGRRTKKGYEYRGVNYIICRNEHNELFIVDKSKTTEAKQNFAYDPEQVQQLARAKALVYTDGELLPIPIYTFGNMYEKEKQLKADKEIIVELYGQDYYEWVEKLIHSNKPVMLRVENPDKSQQPKILALSRLALDIELFSIKQLADDAGVELPERKHKKMPIDDPENVFSLKEAFVIWLDTVKDNDIQGSNKYNIIHYYLGNKRFDKETKESEQIEIRASARVAAEKLFSEFLAVGLHYDDQLKLNQIWNETYNAIGSVNKYRVPVGFTCSRTFKNGLLSIRPVQREGIAFMNIVGAGCLAYDVGVGKTLTAIITLAQAIQQGKCKRALLCVPKPTYNKWKRELFGFWTDGEKKKDTQFRGSHYVTGILSYTGITLNDWQNLGSAIVERLGEKLETMVPENSITLVTFEGINRIGFSRDVFSETFSELVEILENGGPDKSKRDQTIDTSKYKQMMGKGIKNTICDIDVTGFDYLVVDEAHNFKNVFERVGKDEDSTNRNLFGISGSQSERAVKLFFLANHIQRKFGRNVCLLTATPFTNSPLEIYSMLSFIGYETLRQYNLQNIRRFFETFVLESFEYTVTMKDTIQVRSVIKSFNNKNILQKILYNHFDYKTGAEAGVVRPCKINLPMLKTVQDGKFLELPPREQITTYLDMTEAQIAQQKQIVQLVKVAGKSPGVMFRALARSLDNAFSPYLFLDNMPHPELTAKEFVENSPKIYYTVKCIESVVDYHTRRNEPVSGQVIYSNRGKAYFHLIKEYLETQSGFKRRVEFGDVRLDEIEIVDSEISETKKDNIKEAFLAGVVKIIIGTATIKEGIDLQNKGTVLYNLYPDWNPTDMQQLEGRIYRQGNQFGYVRVVMPLVINSMDVFVFQKLEEKSARIQSIWYRADRSNVLDMDSLDAEEIKYALIDNPKELTRLKLDTEAKELEKQLTVAQENLEMYGKLRELIYNYRQSRDQVFQNLVNLYNTLRNEFIWTDNRLFDEGEQTTSEGKEKLKKLKANKEKCEGLLSRIELFQNAVPQSDKELLSIFRSIAATSFLQHIPTIDIYWFDKFKGDFSQVAKAERSILFARGLNINDDLTAVKEELEVLRNDLVQKIEVVKSSEYADQVLAAVTEELRKRSEVRGDLAEQVEAFKRLNIVLSYPADNVDRQNCVIPTEEIPAQAKPVLLLAEPDYANDEDASQISIAATDDNDDTSVLPVTDKKQELEEAIEVLQMLLEDQSNRTKKQELEEAIEVLQMLLEDFAVAA